MTRRLVPRRAALAPLAALLAGALCVSAPPSASAGPPAPPGVSVDGPVDLERLLQLTRLRESMTAKLVYTYTFRQTTTEEDFAEDGTLKDRQVRVYQVVPTPKGVERHLIGKDGREPTPAEERKQEKRNEALQRRFAKMQERAQREAERRRERAAAAAKTAPPPAPPSAPPPAPPSARASAPEGSAPSGSQAAQRATATTTTPAADAAAAASPPQAAAPAAATSTAPIPPAPPAPPAPPTPLAPIPPCDFDDPLASVRPPLPGSVTKASPPGSAATEAARRKRERPSDYSLFELLNLTEHEYAGACTWDGRPMHVVAFRPPAGFDALNPVERVVTAMTGSILIDGSDLEVARAEGATIAPITWGAGMIKLKLARIVLEYGRVHGELWLPRRDVFEMQSRVLFDDDRMRVTHEFDDFMKAETEITTEFGLPAEDEAVTPGAAPAEAPR